MIRFDRFAQHGIRFQTMGNISSSFLFMVGIELIARGYKNNLSSKDKGQEDLNAVVGPLQFGIKVMHRGDMFS